MNEEDHDDLVEECFRFILDTPLYDKHLPVHRYRLPKLVRPILEYDKPVVDDALEVLHEYLIAVWKPIVRTPPRNRIKGELAKTKWEYESTYRDNDRKRWNHFRKLQARRRTERLVNKRIEEGNANFQRLVEQGIIE